MRKILWFLTIAISIGIGAYGALYIQSAQASTVWVADMPEDVITASTASMIESLRPELDPLIRAEIAEAVDNECSSQGLPVELVLAIITRESSFRTMATSSADCVGLMQINPKAHPGLCSPYSRAQLYHIGPNIKIGCCILKEYMRSSSSIQKALRRYVGGAHRTYITDVLATYAELMLEGGKP
jgi:hypothetical protein